VVAYVGGEVWRLDPEDGRMSVLAKGLSLPSAVVAGQGGHGFNAGSVYITTHSGRLHEVSNAVP
jgi:hypothetical protein